MTQGKQLAPVVSLWLTPLRLVLVLEVVKSQDDEVSRSSVVLNQVLQEVEGYVPICSASEVRPLFFPGHHLLKERLLPAYGNW